MSEEKFSQQFKRDAMELLADFYDLVYRGNRSKRASAYDGAGAGGDLIYSFVKLQASQLNQLARLGLAQTEYARNLLEGWYGSYAPGASGAEGDDIAVVGTLTKRAEQKFLVTNRTSDAVTFTFRTTCFRETCEGKEFNHHVAFEPTHLKVKANGAEPVELGVHIDGKAFLAGKTYTALVEVLDGTKVVEQRCLSVEVH
jgi:hypothetical protein